MTNIAFVKLLIGFEHLNGVFIGSIVYELVALRT
jgi:hypothetical protein